MDKIPNCPCCVLTFIQLIICSDRVCDMIVSRLFGYRLEQKVSVLSSAIRKSGYHFALSENCLKDPIDQPVPTKNTPLQHVWQPPLDEN